MWFRFFKNCLHVIIVSDVCGEICFVSCNLAKKKKIIIIIWLSNMIQIIIQDYKIPIAGVEKCFISYRMEYGFFSQNVSEGSSK